MIMAEWAWQDYPAIARAFLSLCYIAFEDFRHWYTTAGYAVPEWPDSYVSSSTESGAECPAHAAAPTAALRETDHLEAVSDATDEEPEAILFTGKAGRPSSYDLVVAKYRSRVENRATARTLNAEAKYLAEWLTEKHPKAPPMSRKTIVGRLRKEYWKDHPRQTTDE